MKNPNALILSQIDTIKRASNVESLAQHSRTSSEFIEFRLTAMRLHLVNSPNRLDRAYQDGRPFASRLGDCVETILCVDRIHIQQARWSEHRRVAASFTSRTMARQIALWQIGLRLYNDSTQHGSVDPTNESFANQVLGNDFCGAVIEVARKTLARFEQVRHE
ncbi:hypothetical protein Pla22_18250 [Rubripirellula amarantea]|uniref:Uncharacterized protein n=1 Tax=Rubripirellula amarantea TaxID=2527999 RepID=A0A5C5WUG3_9BACT|nr:hypothetical protein Pla22_18250 [Rubripirellula amarantea]